jgi:hypothetical protein
MSSETLNGVKSFIDGTATVVVHFQWTGKDAALFAVYSVRTCQAARDTANLISVRCSFRNAISGMIAR